MKKKVLCFLRFIFFEKVFARKLFFNVLENHLTNQETILELGAGRDSYLNKIKNTFKITAIDIHEPSLEIARQNQVYTGYIKGDVRNLPAIIEPKSFDAVVAFDLIEHLTKEEGYKLIEDMSGASRNKVIIYTPNGFLPQSVFDNNCFQEHLSGWDFDEMKRLGFKIYGVNGYRKLRGSFALPRIKPHVLGTFISNLSWLFLKLIGKEKSSFSILCIKDISNKNGEKDERY